MKNLKVIDTLNLEIEFHSGNVGDLQKKLNDNFHFNFEWVSEDLLISLRYLDFLKTFQKAYNELTDPDVGLLIEILRNEKKQKEHSILTRNFTNKSTSTLANFKDECDLKASQIIIKIYGRIINILLNDQKVSRQTN